MEHDPEILNIFLNEAMEILDIWEEFSVRLEKTREKGSLETIFRAAHNLKGSARGVGLVEFSQLLHRLEDFIDAMLKDQVPIDSVNIGILLDSQAFLSSWIEKIFKDANYVAKDSNLIKKIDQIIGQEPLDNDTEAIEDDTFIDFTLLNQSNTEESTSKKTVVHNKEAISGGDTQANALTSEKKLGSGQNPEGDLASKPSAPQRHEQRKQNPDNESKSTPSEKSKINSKTASLIQEESIRVASRKIDALLQITGELSIQKEILWHGRTNQTLNSQICSDAISLIYKNIKDLQNVSFSLRMQPMEMLLKRLERTARDVARKQGKKIDVVLSGIDVELDKNVVEKIKDPLVHILRNSVDHGIESLEERKKKNKGETAQIKISASQHADSISITISDDGRGLQRDRILQKAVEKKLVEPNKEYEDHEIDQFILMPGFSTADKITEISGRGVGLDVVKETVESLGGDVLIKSVENAGSQFEIHLPSTVSILDALVVEISDEEYALPIQDMEEIVDLQDYQLKRTDNKTLIFNLRGFVVPVERLDQYLYIKKPDSEKTKRKIKESEQRIAVISKTLNGYVAFEVDRINGQQSIVARPFNDNLAALPGINGGTILGNGEPGVIINLPAIAKTFFSRIHGEI